MSTDGLSRSLDGLRELLADCPAVRSWMGTGDAAAARARIYNDVLPDPQDPELGYEPEELAALRPFVLLGVADDNGVRSRQEAVGVHLVDVRLVMLWEQDALATVRGRPSALALAKWREALGKMLHEVFERTTRPGLLAFGGLALTTLDHASVEEAKTQGPWLRAVLEVRWRGTL